MEQDRLLSWSSRGLSSAYGAESVTSWSSRGLSSAYGAAVGEYKNYF